MVPVEEEIGHLPGTLEEKFSAWCGPFRDVFGQIATGKWETLLSELDVELVPVGMLRGRTVRNGVLLIDEAQGLSKAQIKTALTRVGYGGRIVLCGDPEQSEFYSPRQSPLLDAAKKLEHLDTVSVIRFEPSDQVRDPLVAEILKSLT